MAYNESTWLNTLTASMLALMRNLLLVYAVLTRCWPLAGPS